MIPTQYTYSRNGATCITPAYYAFLQHHDLVVDATEGGLLMGPSLAEGGFTLIYPTRNAELVIAGQGEGWTFLVNAFAIADESETINRISRTNDLAEQWFLPYTVPSHISVHRIVPREVEGQLLTPVVYFGTTYALVIAKSAAKNHLAELDTLNRAAWLTHYVEKQPESTIRESALLAKFGPSGQN